MYDLNLLPIHLQQGQPGADSGGLLAVTAPRRAARGRAEDTLILALSLGENSQFPPETQQAWLNHLGQVYFKTSGSVTAALRSLIETLNLTLMEKNLKSEGITVTGSVNLAVIHRRSLYLAQSGPTHAFVLNHQGLQDHTDASLSDRGLGISRTSTIRYYQDDLGTGAYFFTTDSPPVSWTEALLSSETFPSMDQLRRRLLNQAPVNFQMALVQLTPGEGRINLIRPVLNGERPGAAQPTQQPTATTRRGAPTPQPAPPMPEKAAEESPKEPPEVRSTPQSEGAAPQDMQSPRQPEDEAQPPAQQPIHETQPQRPMAHLRATQEPDSPQPDQRQRAQKETGAAAREALNRQKAQAEERGLWGLAGVLKWLREAQKKVGTFFKDLVAHWSPEGSDGSPRLSKSSLIFTAVAVPLVVVAIAVGVYLSRGRAQQYTHYYEQAVAYAQASAEISDPAASRNGWELTLELLDEAESYRASDEISQLRNQAQDALDVLDGAVRLDYRPALIGSLYSEINITRIAPFGTDLYLLDEAGGRVIHATRQSQGYEVDADFVCAAGSFNGATVDALVDMVPLPINNPYQAHILAIDALGNIAYCAAGQEPIVMALPAPAGAAGEITAITYNSGYLYALNPAANSIRVYQVSNGRFTEPPTEFFEGSDLVEMPDLGQIVDLTANGQELYLLRRDGMLVDCVSSGLASDPVNCENPVAYVDGRIGIEDQPVSMPEAVYSAVAYTAPPEPSVSILDATNADIYRFSLQFRLYQRLRPEFGDYEVDKAATSAFTIGIDRVAFLAFGHQLFFAYVD